MCMRNEKLLPPLGPYSHYKIAESFVFVSGQIPQDNNGNILSGDSIEAQTELALTNLSNVLTCAGSSLDKAVKVNIYLTDFSLFDRMNAIYRKFFESGSFPARCCVEVSGLAEGVLIEIDAVATL